MRDWLGRRDLFERLAASGHQTGAIDALRPHELARRRRLRLFTEERGDWTGKPRKQFLCINDILAVENPIRAGSLVFVPNGNGHSIERRGKNPLIVVSTLVGSSCDRAKSTR